MISKKVKLASEISYRPMRIGLSERYWCIYCKRDYKVNHRHFNFTIQKRLGEEGKGINTQG